MYVWNKTVVFAIVRNVAAEHIRLVSDMMYALIATLRACQFFSSLKAIEIGFQ